MEVYIGRDLREFKESIGAKEDELADSLCISQSALNKYLNDKLPTPLEVVINIIKNNKPKGIEIAWKWKAEFEKEFIKAVTV